MPASARVRASAPRASVSWSRSIAPYSTLPKLASFLVLVLGSGIAEAGATITRHTYRLDASRVEVAPHASGATLRAEGLPRTWERDQPELPYDIVTLLVPLGSRVVQARAISVQERVVAEAVALRPAGARFTDTGDAVQPKPARLAGKSSSGGDARVYPAIRVEPGGSGALHGYQMVSVRVYPVRYEAASGRVYVAQEIELEIELAPGGERPLQRERYSASIESSARRTLARLVDNPELVAGYDRRVGVLVEEQERGFRPTDAPSLEGSPVQYVIITSQALESSFQVLADWKTRRGIPTVVRTLEWIEASYRHGSDLQETIRTFIQDAYAKWAVEYVLLGGDTDVVPARIGFSEFGPDTEEDIPTDMYFACLDGNWNADGDGVWGEAAVGATDPGDNTDLYAEVYVGRLPVSTGPEAGALIAKILEYENPTQTAYQDELLLLGEVLFPVDWQPGLSISLDGADFSDDMASLTNSCTTVKKLYENYTQFPGAVQLTLQNTIDEMNAGYGFVNHIGHGFRYNMSCGDVSLVNSHAAALTNTDQRFVLYLLNCTATAFDFPCLAEAFLKSSGGAVAVLGSSRAAFALPAFNYNRDFFQALHRDSVVNVGKTFVESRLAFTSNAWFDTSDHYMHFLYNMLADPEMVIHTCVLGTTAATYPSSIGLGLTNVLVHVTVDGVPREGALVCLQKGVEEYVSGVTDANGDVTLGFVAESGGSVDVAVSGPNMTMLFDTFSVDASGVAYVHTQSLSLDDDQVGASFGNADGVLDAGETVELGVVFKNDGSQVASGVTGVLRSDSPWATVQDSTYTVGTVVSGGTGSSSGELRFTVDQNTPDGTVIPLRFVSGDGSSTWTDVVNKVVHAPVMELTLLDVDDAPPGGNGDGIIQAGETFDLIPSFKNYGTGAVDELDASIITADPDLVFIDNRVDVGRVEPAQEVTGPTAYRLTESVIEENVMLMILTDSHNRVTTFGMTLRGPGQPATPQLDASQGADVVVAIWTPSAEPDIAGYHLYRALSDTASTWARVTVDRTVNVAYIRDTGLMPSTEYFYYTTAV
ncbi:MAG: C25 family cysteine peptidase, partial [Candidatus Krumholzibacteriia bacterium]